MHVSKWGNSLAIRLPRKLVEALKLREGDQLEVLAAEPGRIEVARRMVDTAAFDAQIASLAVPTPVGYRFEREEANAR